MKMRIGTAAALFLGSLAAVVGTSNPASAACVANLEYTTKAPANSDKFNGSTACNGAWAVNATLSADLVRAQYYDGGAWIQSTYGWVDVKVSNTNEKVVGNTIDGRRMRGEVHDINQFIKYRY